MRTKRIIGVIMALMLAGTFTACGSASTEGEKNVSSASSVTEQSTVSSEQSAVSSKESAASNVSEKSGQQGDADGEDGQNPIMNFIGPYQGDRASMKVEAEGNDGALITVSWSSSVDIVTKWTMSGTLNSETMTMDYSNCKKVTYTYNENGDIINEDVGYENGKGSIVFNSDYTIEWKDDEENSGDGLVFEFASEADEEYSESTVEDVSGTAEESTTESTAVGAQSVGIEKSDAIGEIRMREGSGAQILSVEEGFSPDGLPAWVITVAPITASDEEVILTYYVGDQFCYAE